MFEPRHARYYAFVHPAFWPWLWLQLWLLTRWQRKTRRVVLIHIDRFGNIHIKAVADDPQSWHPAPPRVPAWTRPELASDLPANLAAHAILSSVVLPLTCRTPLMPAGHVTARPAWPDTS